MYKIKDVSERSGFSPATLRYYEEIGLLPRSARTQAGYRQYDDRTVERLAFISRAKQLGCTLEEIAELAIAWDGGQCGPVQDRLRNAVAQRLAGARQQILELTAFSNQLSQAAVILELHRPQGPCDDQCGCVGEPVPQAAAQHLSISAKPTTLTNLEQPIACTAGPQLQQQRIAEWQALLTHVATREVLPAGVRVSFSPSVPLPELMRLTAAEQDCCRFFNFAITVDTRGVGLEVSAPADALPIVHALFGVPA